MKFVCEVVHHAQKINLRSDWLRDYFYPDSIARLRISAASNQQVMPDDHSALAPPLPIPNRTVKRRRADDSAATSVKVGNRQACYNKAPPAFMRGGVFPV